MYIVAGPDPNPRGPHGGGGGGQLPNPNECSSMLTNGTRGEALTLNPNECNSTLTSATKVIYPYRYIDVESGVTDDKGSHKFSTRCVTDNAFTNTTSDNAFTDKTSDGNYCHGASSVTIFGICYSQGRSD